MREVEMAARLTEGDLIGKSSTGRASLIRISILALTLLLVAPLLAIEAHSLAHPCDGERTAIESWFAARLGGMLRNEDKCCLVEEWVPRLSSDCKCRCKQKDAR
jgi:hypothetical protein